MLAAAETGAPGQDAQIRPSGWDDSMERCSAPGARQSSSTRRRAELARVSFGSSSRTPTTNSPFDTSSKTLPPEDWENKRVVIPEQTYAKAKSHLNVQKDSVDSLDVSHSQACCGCCIQ